ncbi:MAG: phospholipid carrier-dependent glycosyltransferase [Chloroflexi bacterium]|nr:phospholipid carrier-dependent glycosyltransferase [Chloroflexota bacterium]
MAQTQTLQTSPQPLHPSTPPSLLRPRRTLGPWLVAWLALGVVWWGQRQITPSRILPSLLLYLAGGLAFIYLSRRPYLTPPLAEDAAPATPVGWASVLTAPAQVTLLAAVVISTLGLIFFGPRDNPNLGWICWALSLLVVVAGAGLLDVPARPDGLKLPLLRPAKGQIDTIVPSEPGTDPVTDKATSGSWYRFTKLSTLSKLTLAGIEIHPDYVVWGLTLLGLVLRLYHLDSLPFGTWFDEAQNALVALQMLGDPGFRPVYLAQLTQQPTLFLYPTALMLKLFGDTTWSVRLVAALAGAATVPAMYFLGKELFGRRFGLLAAFFLAISSWHITFSRLAFNAIWSPLWNVLTMALLFRALRTGRLRDYALAGISLGLSVNFYYTSRLLPFVIILFLLHQIIQRGPMWLLRRWRGGLVFAAGLLLAVAPLAQFAVTRPNEFFNRLEQTSVFKWTAEAGNYQPLIDNVEKHLGMFTLQGDPNGRHNLPNTPMLDPIMAGLFVVGVVYSLWNMRDRRYAFIISWAVVMLAGGVFSVPFEAPQGLRTLDEVIATCLLAAIPIAILWREGESLGHSFSWRYGMGLVMVIPVVLAGYNNVDKYFRRQATDFSSWNAHSTPETEIALALNRYGNGYRFLITGFYFGHPATRFLAPGIGNQEQWNTTSTLPIDRAGPKGVVLMLEPEHETPVFDELQRLYPGGKFQRLTAPFGGPPNLFIAELSPADISGIQGVVAEYRVGDSYPPAGSTDAPAQTTREATIDLDWSSPPLPLPFTAEFNGTLRINKYGPYRLQLQAPAQAELYIDEVKVIDVPASGAATAPLQAQVILAKGNHALRLRAKGAAGPLRLSWEGEGSVLTAPAQPIPATALYTSPPVDNHGLLGKYYPNVNWSGQPAFEQVDPSMALRFHILPLPRPYSVEWSGAIDIPFDGTYRFGTESIDHSWLWIDDTQVVTNDGPTGQYRDGTINLTQGIHKIRVRYTDETAYTYINVYWTPPSGGRQTLPTERIYPPQGAYPPPRKAVNLPPPVVQGGLFTGLIPPGSIKSEFARSLTGGAAGMSDPRDVAAAKDGRLYVVETAAKRVIILNAEGAVTGQLEGEFVQPFGVTIGAGGQVVVLDSQAKDPLQIFTSDGKPAAKIGGDVGLYSPRGIFADPVGNLYIADTGGSRVVKLAPTGQKLGEFRAGGQLNQPVSVAVTQGGVLYVVDSGKNILWVLDPSDVVLQSWPIPKANTFDAAHVAIGPNNAIYLSDPESGIVNIYDPRGTSIGQVGTRGSGDGQFNKPTGLRIDTFSGPGGGRLWVADTLNKRVEQWNIR